jgi:UDP-N-acetyl-D-glucosamine/UDP-N-acetyl-D-galactosamine dehydrogenase
VQSIANIAVVGLGYVGLPLAVGLASHFRVTGFDLNATRIAELKTGHDRTGEIELARLKASTLALTAEPGAMAGADIFIVTVPTPIDAANRPDLGAVVAASRTVGQAIKKGGIVVLESTVYPGVTEDIVGPAVAAASGLVCGVDFFLGYSPERINPGDREHTIERITKVVAGQTPEVAERLGAVYGAINGGNVFLARDIRTAEAAKVIENAQRDINIAFINEITMIFNKMGLSAHDVLAAARTKWNFLPFTPGLVGGHCISVDPYYLAEAAMRLKHHPDIILAGRRTNDSMAAYCAGEIARLLRGHPGISAKILVLGIAFKENVPDLRNTKVVDLADDLRARGHAVDIYDPVVDAAEAKHEYGVVLLDRIGNGVRYDAVVAAVGHRSFADLDLAALTADSALLFDIKGVWRGKTLPAGRRYRAL